METGVACRKCGGQVLASSIRSPRSQALCRRCNRQKLKEWRARDPEHVRAYRRRPEARKWQREYVAKRRRVDREFAFERRCRAKIYQAVRMARSLAMRGSMKAPHRQDGYGISLFLSACGFSVEALRLHLEKQFVGAMNWASYGESWELDHIAPIASFEGLKSFDDERFKLCWGLSNYRPLQPALNRIGRKEVAA